MNSETQRIADIVGPILRKAEVTRAGLFGSYVRGEQHKDSDVDILVEYPTHFSLFDAIALEQTLSDALGIHVDLVSLRGLSPYIRPQIMRELVPVYE